MGDLLRVGVIGCGEATQALHVPVLNSLAQLFRMVACCDLSPEVMAEVAGRTGTRPIADPLGLIADPTVDVVLVATPDAYHAEAVIAACQAKKRAVVVEKPAALNSRIAQEMADSASTSGVPVLVDYPHVYDPAVQRAKEVWGLPDGLRYGEFRCCIGPNARYIADIVHTIRPSRRDRWASIMSQLDHSVVTTELLGTRIAFAHVLVHGFLLGLTIHDLPVLRRFAGEPRGIDYARARTHGAPFNPAGIAIDVLFDYGDGRVLLQTELVDMKSTDWGFRLRRDGLHVSVHYPTTYAAAAPSVCIVRQEKGDMTVDEQHGGQYETGFRRLWKHVHDVVTQGATPLTPIEDAVRDIELAERIMAVIAARDGEARR